MINIYFSEVVLGGRNESAVKNKKPFSFKSTNPPNTVTVVTWSRLMPVKFIQKKWHLKNISIECRSYKTDKIILKRLVNSGVKTSKLPGSESVQAWQLRKRSGQHIKYNSI